MWTSEDVKVGYKVTLTGRVLKTRCRKRSQINRPLPGLLPTADVPESIYEAANAYLPANCRDVKGAALNLMESREEGV